MHKIAALALALAITCFTLAGCGGATTTSSSGGAAASAGAASAGVQGQSIDYLALVNKLNALPDRWEDSIETEHFTNTVGDDVEVEKKAYEAYLALKGDLEKDGIFVDLDSARRSVADQERIMKEFTEQYGADYAKKTVAEPGHSEHHTGLALDLYLIVDGKDIVENEDMMKYPEIWAKIHAKLADHGFILRYLEGAEHITGYGYEPWHIRYIDDPAIAKEITTKGITLEEYVAGKEAPEVSYDFGKSELYKQEELEAAAVQVKCEFASFAGCELHNLRYAGDECNTEENLKWLNSIEENSKDAAKSEGQKKYTQVVEFLADFHTPTGDVGAWEPDTEMQDYQWWLARSEGEGWQLITNGY